MHIENSINFFSKSKDDFTLRDFFALRLNIRSEKKNLASRSI